MIHPYLAKYPFLDAARETVGEYERDEIFAPDVLDRASERVAKGVNSGKTGPIPNNQDEDPLSVTDVDPEVELLSYPAARILVSLIGDYRIVNRYARAEAQTARERLVKGDFKLADDEDDDDFGIGGKRVVSRDEILDEYGLGAVETTPADQFHRTHTSDFFAAASGEQLREFARDVFAIRDPESALPDDFLAASDPEDIYAALHNRSPLDSPSAGLYEIPFEDYLSVSAGLSDDRWRLTNRGVKDGSLVTTHVELMDIIEEAIYGDISERLPHDVPDDLAERLGETVETVNEEIDEEHFSYQIDRVEEGLFPPVIKQMLEDFPFDLKHEEKVTLGAFLIHIGMSVDEAIEFLGVKGTPGEDPTRYQVKHIATGGGSGDPYTPANYATIEAWGYKWEKDALEAKVTNPLTYYKIKLQEADEEEGDDDDGGDGEADGTDADENVAPKSTDEMEGIDISPDELARDAEE